MTKKRNVVLFGAGAVIDWGGPKTPDLTDFVRNCGFYTRDGKTRITEFIYNKLINAPGYDKNDINFETIINVIEELIVYYANHGQRKKVPALMKPFFSPNFEQEILNFSVIGGEIKQLYKLHIPGKDDEWALMNHGQETPEQFFLQQLLAHLLTGITIEIDHYAYHTASKSNVITESNKEINELFQDWIHLVNGNDTLRMYTLNYDRNFKILLARSKYQYEIFEGFDCGDVVGYTDQLKPQARRILADQDSNTHYNLHGSVFWRVRALNQYQLELPEFYLACGAYLEQNTNEFPTFQSEKGKTVFLTNLITGYQKTQRAIFSPFRQMQAAFDRDCIFCDKLIIIGYSFSDEHINSSIRTALQENKNLHIEIIDPSFKKNEFDLMVMLKIFAASDRMYSDFPKNLSENVHSFLSGSVTVHAKTFRNYMEDTLKKASRSNFNQH
ncbi:SIR2 family protein [Chitinophaga sp. MM2321]|uniref:SIR2 family protein n=1 Tax=Chitinophaga sp. MM2321 TaxID=3137178 RepID=UPI0032D567A5